jgi:hypothetical protein
MLKMLKRLAGLEPEPAQRVKRVAAPKRRIRDYSGPLPLPEVTEGSEPTDWDLWEDSVNSQMQGLSASPKKSYADTVPSELDGLDPFSRVSKNSDL